MRAQGALTKPSDMYSLVMGDEVDALGRHGKTMFVLGRLDFLYIFGGFEEGAELRRQFSLVENAVYCTWSAIAGVFSTMWKTFLENLKVNNERAAVHALTTYTCHVESEAPQPGQPPRPVHSRRKGCVTGPRAVAQPQSQASFWNPRRLGAVQTIAMLVGSRKTIYVVPALQWDYPTFGHLGYQ